MKKRTAVSLICIILAAIMISGCGLRSRQPLLVSNSAKTAEASVKEEEALKPEQVAADVTPEAEPETTPEVTPEETPEPTPEATPEPTPEPVIEDRPELPEGQMYSYLTGEVVSTEIGSRRPFAVMTNNLKPAIPQSSISQADIMYEAYVEGSITRLLSVFQDVSGLEKIGPVRSARHYYIDFANDNEALFVHFGQSGIVEDLIRERSLTTINGLNLGKDVFFRSTDRKAPHNAYTFGSGLEKIAEKKKMSRDYPENYEPNLKFRAYDQVPSEGTDAVRVNLPYPVNNPYFIYNADDSLYYRYQYGGEHKDKENGEQLKFKNIIVQYVNQWTIQDADHHQNMELWVEGKGLYITDGKAIEITWKKTGWDDNTRYYTADGEVLVMNPGKTMFEIVPQTETVTLKTEA